MEQTEACKNCGLPKPGTCSCEDRKCVECGEDFVYTTGDQEYYKAHGYFPPKRCPKCRKKRREEREANVPPPEEEKA